MRSKEKDKNTGPGLSCELSRGSELSPVCTEREKLHHANVFPRKKRKKLLKMNNKKEVISQKQNTKHIYRT
jgi:hypothetical protein